MTSPGRTLSPRCDDRLLVDAGVLVRALVLDQRCRCRAWPTADRRLLVLVGRTTMRAASTDSTTPSRLATSVTPESRATMPSMPVPMSGAAVLDERHGLALHVRAHERAVRVVVLEERDQRGGHRDELVRRHVHQVDVFGLGHDEVAVVARRHRRRR